MSENGTPTDTADGPAVVAPITRAIGRPFPPGQSGNPKGRAKGSRNDSTRAAQELMKAHAEEAVRVLVEQLTHRNQYVRHAAARALLAGGLAAAERDRADGKVAEDTAWVAGMSAEDPELLIQIIERSKQNLAAQAEREDAHIIDVTPEPQPDDVFTVEERNDDAK